MSYEKSHGKVRVTPPRASDNANHADGANGVDRSRDHARDGRFLRGNRAAVGTGTKRTIRNLVPRHGRKLYAELCAQLGASGGVLAYMHAADSVNHTLAAAELAGLARAAGLGTDEGRKLDELSTRHSEAALRSATAALDAARLFARPGAAKRKAGPPPGFAGDNA